MGFRRAWLGQWVRGGFSKWISGELWQKLDKKTFDHIHIAADLSISKDRTAISVTEQKDKGFYFRTFYYLPEGALKSYRKVRRDKTLEYAQDGWIKIQKGEVIDLDQIFSDLKDIIGQSKKSRLFLF